MEESDQEDGYGDGRIGDVENRIEEGEVVASYERHPFRPIEVKERELEHIDHLSVEEGRITSIFGQERSHLAVAQVEDLPVEDAVDDVAKGAGCQQGDADDVAQLQILFDGLGQVVEQGEDGDDSEDGEEDLVEELYTEGHSVVFYEGDVEPRGDLVALAEHEVRLYPDFDHLVEDEDEEGDGGCHDRFVGVCPNLDFLSD